MRLALTIAAFAAMAASVAHGQTVQFDPGQHARNLRADIGHVRLERCVRDQVWVALSKGERDRMKLADSAATFCAPLAVYAGLVENIQEAVVSVDELAYQLVPDVAANGP